MKKTLQILLLTLIITTCTLNQGVNKGDKGDVNNTNDNLILTILERDKRADDNKVIGIDVEIITFLDETILTKHLDLSNGENVLRTEIENAMYKLKIVHEFENGTSFNDYNYHIGVKEDFISQATITAGEMGSISTNSSDGWETGTTIPNPFGAFGYAVVNDQIYIIGGSNKDVTADVYVQRYTPATDTWEQLADLPAPRAVLYCGVINGKIHAIGGWNENQSYMSEHYIYDPDTDTWTNGVSIPNFPIGQFATTINNKIYVFGGWWGSYQTTVLEYSEDTGSGIWTQKAAMPTARNHGATAVYNGEIYVIAGETRLNDKNCQPIDIVEKYNPDDDEWTTGLAPMPDQLHWLGSSGCPVSSDGLIYVLGPGNTAYTYNPITDSWDVIDEMPGSAYGVANIENSIYAIGPDNTYKCTLPDYSEGYYVSKNGNDDNDGSEANPWLTIDHAASTLEAGETCYVKTGTYNEKVVFDHSGNDVDGYITLQTYQDDEVIIDGTGIDPGYWTALIQADAKSYIRIQGFHIMNLTAPASSTIRFGTYNGPISNIEISNVEIAYHDSTLPPLYISGRYNHPAEHILIDNCEVHHCNTANFEAIRINGAVYYFKIINNKVHNNSNIGIDCVGWGTQPAYGLIKNNICYRNGLIAGGAHGIYLDGAKFITIEDNICYDNPRGGIQVAAEYSGEIAHHNIVRRNIVYNGGVKGITLGGSGSENGEAQDCAIIHNTIYNSSTGWHNQVKINYLKGTNLVYNNIFYDDQEGDIINHQKTDNEGDILSDYNCFYSTKANTVYMYMANPPCYSLSCWQSMTGKDLHSISSNPLFIDAPNNNFQLQASSPCINAGDFLTRTVGSGSGTIIPVQDARPFCDGYGFFDGDMIKVGSYSVKILAVDYTNNKITVNQSISWDANDGVSYSYNGSKPDIGVYEY